MSIRVTVQGAAQAASAVLALPDRAKRRALLGMSQAAYDAMLEGANRHTGARRSLAQSLINAPDGENRWVRHDMGILQGIHGSPFIAHYVTGGTRPHTIVPRNKKALRWAKNGEFFFARRVRHPGYVGDDYITPAATRSLDWLRDNLDALFME